MYGGFVECQRRGIIFFGAQNFPLKGRDHRIVAGRRACTGLFEQQRHLAAGLSDLVVAQQRADQSIALRDRIAEILRPQRCTEISDGIRGRFLPGHQLGAHQLEIKAVGDQQVGKIAHAILDFRDTVAGDRVVTHIVGRVIVNQPGRSLQPPQKLGHGVGIEAGFFQ